MVVLDVGGWFACDVLRGKWVAYCTLGTYQLQLITYK